MFQRFNRFRSTRRGSAIVMMTIFAMIIGFSVAALMSFAVARRRDTARLIVYNADLAAAEHMLDRVVSTAYFVGQNSPRQYAGDSDGVRDLVAEMGGSTFMGSDGGDGDPYDDDVVMVQTRALADTEITSDIITELGPELAPWEGFTLQLESYQLMAWARATGDAGIAYAGSFARPGVWVSRNVTYYAVPLFNYAIFYENLFEMDGGGRIDVYGKVHTNEDWYLTTSNEVYYHQNCTVAGRFFGGIYNPLDGQRRSWYAGSDKINIASVRNPGLAPGDPASTLARLRNQTLINKNKGYLSSHIYNPGDPNGNPLFNAGDWAQRDYDSDGDGTVDDMNGDGDALDYLDGPDRYWQDNPAWVDQSRTMFNNYLRDSSHGVDNVRLPIEEQNSPYLLIEAPDVESAIDPADPNRQRPLLSGGKAVFNSVEDVPVDFDDPNGPRYDKLDVSLAYQASVVLETNAALGNWESLSDSAFLTAMTNENPADDPVIAYRIELSKDEDGNVIRTKEPFAKLWYNTGVGGNKLFLTRKRIYNGREGKYVNLLDINAGLLKEYLQYTTTDQGAFELSHPGNGLDNFEVDDGVIYVNMIQSTVAGTEEAGFRLSNAADLNGVVSYAGIEDYKGLTFATNGPLYTKGDINKTNKIPLMLAGDSINPLSSAFDDNTYSAASASSANSGNGPKATANSTETNAVFVSGNVPTRLNQYGGGGENYFRYIENWSGKTHKYRGSILNLFESRIALGTWDKDNTANGVNSGYYGLPVRDWGWDTSYAAGQAPPGIPTSRQMAIGRWQLMNSTDVEEVLENGDYTEL